ncbi:MAG: hypothetical protein FJY66_04245, partial [Calditrichaeota bacterium]|nr:hypothetical protein [Calditrichota bacterium]
MKIGKWICFGVPILIGVGMLVASQPKGWQLEPPRRIDWSDSLGHKGRPLTTAESTVVAACIESIATPPPSTFVCTLNNRRCTLRADCVAAALRRQLRRPGGIEAETGPAKGREGACANPDGKTSPEGDAVNINEDWLLDPYRWRRVEYMLIHEYAHKCQDSATLGSPRGREIQADLVTMAYKDCTRMSHEDSYFKQESTRVADLRSQHSVHHVSKALAYDCYIRYDSVGGVAGDSLICFQFGTPLYYSYPFGGTRASDLSIVENHFMLPDSHCLGIVCGGVPSMNLARILLLDIYQGEAVGLFGTFDYPGMFFCSMTHSPTTGLTYFLDSLNQQILAMADQNGDLVPDEIVSIYASAFWPGFEPLMHMWGIDAGWHRYLGAGIIVNHFNIHFLDCIYPYDQAFFLPDYDGNDTADACLFLPMYEFLFFVPVIQVPLPWEGDTFVMLHATWDHDIAVWTTDPLGEILFEQLGMVHMVGGVDAECMLMRP